MAEKNGVFWKDCQSPNLYFIKRDADEAKQSIEKLKKNQSTAKK